MIRWQFPPLDSNYEIPEPSYLDRVKYRKYATEGTGQVSRILVTGGAGFIGSNFVRFMMENKEVEILNLDLLTYAGNRNNLSELEKSRSYRFQQGDIGNRTLVNRLLDTFKPTAVVNFAAESHVDRSIDKPAAFIETNLVGTSHLLSCVLNYWRTLTNKQQETFRFLHLSTDEVYGTLGQTGAFLENSRYAPNSPYAASKAGSDHLVRAWHKTYELPAVTINSSNNYGPYQYSEKLIPLIILNALDGKPLPIYGDGQHIRDWLYVIDHCRGIAQMLESARPGQTYNIGGHSEKTNLEVVTSICQLLDELQPDSPYYPHCDLISFVDDRPGHDRRYSIDTTKIQNELGWEPLESFDSGLCKTVKWYLNNRQWYQREHADSHLRQRLGLAHKKIE